MKFKLENINNIQHADINLDGIAVITGSNESGKSTIARVLCTVCAINDKKVHNLFYDEDITLINTQGHVVLADQNKTYSLSFSKGYKFKTRTPVSNNDSIVLNRTLLKLKGVLPRGAFKRLISDGRIQHNGFLVIDEPETHLHPSKQLEAAETIVMMRKQFGLHVLLTTNSPYFLHAMEVYSAYHKIADQCFYYLAVSKDGGIEFENVNGNIDRIYKEFLAPIQKLKNVEAEIDE